MLISKRELCESLYRMSPRTFAYMNELEYPDLLLTIDTIFHFLLQINFKSHTIRTLSPDSYSILTRKMKRFYQNKR